MLLYRQLQSTLNIVWCATPRAERNFHIARDARPGLSVRTRWSNTRSSPRNRYGALNVQLLPHASGTKADLLVERSTYAFRKS